MTDLTLLRQTAATLGFDLTDGEAKTVAAAIDTENRERQESRPDSSGISLEEAAARAGRPPYAVENICEDFTTEGFARPGYEAVREAFESNFRNGLERNAQLCVYRNGECVVDLSGSNGEAGMSTAPDTGYAGDTLQSVYSSGKAIESTIFAMAVDRGLLKYEDLVIEHWPEFGQQGKASMTVADVLRHDAGLHAFDEALTPEDINDQANRDGNLSSIIAAQAPWTWREGKFKGKVPRVYHAVSRGYILSQILMRADPAGRTIGQWMAEELCGPINADFYCGPSDTRFRAGLPEAAMHFRSGPDRAWQYANGSLPAMIRRLLPERFGPTPMEAAMAEARTDPLYPFSPEQDPQGRLTSGRPSPMGFEVDPGDVDSRFLEITSSSSRASARGMARIMGLLGNGGILDGKRVLSEEGCNVAVDHPVSAADRPNGRFGMAASVFVQGGWGVTGPGVYGWGGAGGSVIQFSPARRTGFGYACTGFAAGISGDQDRVGPIARAIYQATGDK